MTMRSRRQPSADKLRDLARLLAALREEDGEDAGSGRLRLLAQLRLALQAQRRRGVRGHWAYDLTRHRNLLQAYRNVARSVVDRPPR